MKRKNAPDFHEMSKLEGKEYDIAFPAIMQELTAALIPNDNRVEKTQAMPEQLSVPSASSNGDADPFALSAEGRAIGRRAIAFTVASLFFITLFGGW